MNNDVSFENQGEEFGSPPRSGGFSLSGLLVKWGLVSSRQEAQYVLLAIGVLAFVIAVYFFVSLSGGDTLPPPPPNMAPLGT